MLGGIAWNDYVNEHRLTRDDGARSFSFYCSSTPPCVDNQMMEALKSFSITENSDVRICLHDNPRANFQNMIILHRSCHFYRPHRHVKNGEIYHLLDGVLGIPFFNSRSLVTSLYRLSMDDCVMASIPVNADHAMFPLSEVVIFHECKLGPFVPGEDTIVPDWAPAIDDDNGINLYKDRITKYFN